VLARGKTSTLSPIVMIAVSVGHVHRREVLSDGGYPTGEDLHLRRGHQWVD
jgi:hypothetical protein